MSTVIFTRGLPASGKSTAAKAWVAEDPDNRVRVCLDDLREMIGPYDNFSSKREDWILCVQDYFIVTAVLDGKDCIVDATHLHDKTPRRIADTLHLYQCPVVQYEIMDFTDVLYAECEKRNKNRGFGERKVPARVMAKMEANLTRMKREGLWTIEDMP